MRGHFGWEYKGKHKDLKAAYAQLLLYREALENPPLLVVCDMDRFEVHTNFTDTAKRVYVFDLAGLANGTNLDILRRVFTDPQSLKPGITSETMTVEAADGPPCRIRKQTCVADIISGQTRVIGALF